MFDQSLQQVWINEMIRSQQWAIDAVTLKRPISRVKFGEQHRQRFAISGLYGCDDPLAQRGRQIYTSLGSCLRFVIFTHFLYQ